MLLYVPVCACMMFDKPWGVLILLLMLHPGMARQPWITKASQRSVLFNQRGHGKHCMHIVTTSLAEDTAIIRHSQSILWYSEQGFSFCLAMNVNNAWKEFARPFRNVYTYFTYLAKSFSHSSRICCGTQISPCFPSSARWKCGFQVLAVEQIVIIESLQNSISPCGHVM